MQQTYKKKNQQKRSFKHKMSPKSELRLELKSWADIISEKILTDYALPITKNVEIKLHQLNEKIEHGRAKNS